MEKNKIKGAYITEEQFKNIAAKEAACFSKDVMGDEADPMTALVMILELSTFSALLARALFRTKEAEDDIDK